MNKQFSVLWRRWLPATLCFIILAVVSPAFAQEKEAPFTGFPIAETARLQLSSLPYNYMIFLEEERGGDEPTEVPLIILNTPQGFMNYSIRLLRGARFDRSASWAPNWRIYRSVRDRDIFLSLGFFPTGSRPQEILSNYQAFQNTWREQPTIQYEVLSEPEEGDATPKFIYQAEFGSEDNRKLSGIAIGRLPEGEHLLVCVVQGPNSEETANLIDRIRRLIDGAELVPPEYAETLVRPG